MSLHDELSRLADTAPRPAIDHTVWDRGRALRRRDRLVSSAIVLVTVVILGGLASIVLGPPRAVAPAGDTVPDGAIPSKIENIPADLTRPLEEDLAIGLASVAYISDNGVPVAIGATDGDYHLLELPELPTDRGPLALSPDGTKLAWQSVGLIHVADLRSGEITDLTPTRSQPTVTGLHWATDSRNLIWTGSGKAPKVGLIDVVTSAQSDQPRDAQSWPGVLSPDHRLVALPTTRDTTFVRFQQDGSCCLFRTLAKDLYPDGATVTPLGWASDSLVLAEASAGAGSYVEGRHLALFTSPDRPKSEWTYRILVRELPQAIPVSVAVDLIPELDGTANQQLTHDFGEPDWPAERDISRLIGLGVAGALSVLYGLRWLWRRRTGP